MQKLLLISCLLIIASGCREKFYADIPSPATGYLITEGVINIGDKVKTEIRLARTTELDNQEIRFEDNARVFIEDQLNTKIELSHTDSGRYISPELTLAAGRQYRIRILSQEREYVSQLTEAKISPEIDSLFWVVKDDGIEIQLTTHDSLNASSYYNWSFVETWEYSTPYYSTVKFDSATIADPVLPSIVPRGPSDPPIYTCWKTVPSSTIVIGTTVKLSQDLIYGKPINFVSASASNRLVSKYSIIVKQSVLPKEGFEYLQRMRKNTELTGSVFDTQPSELRGNITCINDTSEIVVGFISASSFTEKRIFVKRAELPPMNINTLYQECYLEKLPYIRDTMIYWFASGSYIPVEAQEYQGRIVEVTYSYNKCVDCRKLGGSNQRPSFW